MNLSRTSPVATLLGVLLVLMTLAACESPPTPTPVPTPTPTITPEDIYAVSEIRPTCQDNPAKCRVSIYIRDTISGFHPDKDEFFLGASRDTSDWTTLRVHSNAEFISEVDSGDQVFLRCDDLAEERSHSLPFLGVDEYRCTQGKMLEPLPN